MYECVLLEYSYTRRFSACIFTEFFKFAGIYAIEVNRELLKDKKYDNDNILLIDADILPGLCETEQLKNIKAILTNKIDDSDFLNAYDTLLKSFCEYNLSNAGTLINFFKQQGELTKNAGKNFEKAGEYLSKIIEDHKNSLSNNRYIQYAETYCWMMANEARFINHTSVAAYVNILADQCISIIKNYNDYIIAYVLLGDVYKNEKSRFGEMYNAYTTASTKTKNQFLISEIANKIDCKCERYASLKTTAITASKQAYDKDKNFKTTYRLALTRERQKDYSEAIKLFQESLDINSKNNEYKYPIEEIYYFFASTHIGFIYLEYLHQPDAAIPFLEQAVNFQNDCIVNQHYIIKMYGQPSDEYLKYIKEKMPVHQPYAYLVKAYCQTGDKKTAEEYNRKFIETTNAFGK